MAEDTSLDTAFAEAVANLQSAGIEHADFEALQLMALASGTASGQLRLWRVMGSSLDVRFTPELRAEICEKFRALAARRARREPLQYLLGSVGFRYIEVEVGTGVFIPRPETEIVVEAGIQWLRSHSEGMPQPLVVDLCAGSGVIGLSVAAELATSTVYAVEMSDAAYAWLTRNARKVAGAAEVAGTSESARTCEETGNLRTAFEKRYHALQADATDSRTLAELDGRVDCVISNPPYVPLDEPPTQPEVAYDPATALFGGSPDGMAIPEALIRRSAALLKRGGFLVMEHDISQPAAIRHAMEAAGFMHVENHDDLTGRPRYTTGVRA